eukprot:3721484-Alexandrium_andersonii.AAC.1
METEAELQRRVGESAPGAAGAETLVDLLRAAAINAAQIQEAVGSLAEGETRNQATRVFQRAIGHEPAARQGGRLGLGSRRHLRLLNGRRTMARPLELRPVHRSELGLAWESGGMQLSGKAAP